jgi:type II secretory pathway component PulK
MRMKLRNKAARGPRGIALIIVMISIFILAVLAAGFAYSMKVETKLASNSNNELQMEWMGRSGVELARYVLGQEMGMPSMPYDALNQIWAGGPGGPSETNSAMTAVSLKNNTLGDGTFSVTITDLERKVNINTAVNNGALLEHALINMGVDASDISVIVSSIQDWIDLDDQPRPGGAESDYYQSLTPAYFAKNGPVVDLTELLFVKGITPEMYWGSFSTNHPQNVFPTHQAGGAHMPNDTPTYPFGLNDIFTPFSNGTINLNTAPASTLTMIPGIDETTAQQIIRMRAGPDGIDGTDDDTPLNNVGELVNVLGQNAAAIGQISQYCGVRSSTFEVKVDVQVGMSRRRYTPLLRRNTPKDIQIMSFRWDY